MKGQTSELLNILLLVVSVFLMFIVSYFLILGTRSSEKRRLELQSYKRLSAAINEIFYSKVPFIEKTPSQLLSDSIRRSRVRFFYDEMVYYGKAYGWVNVTQIISSLMNSYFDRWYMVGFIEGKKVFEFGNIENKKGAVAYNILVPISGYGGEFIDVHIEAW